MTKKKALELLEKSIQTTKGFEDHVDWASLISWIRDVQNRIKVIFGRESEQALEIENLFKTYDFESDDLDFEEASNVILGYLYSYYTEVEELWNDEVIDLSKEQIANNVSQSINFEGIGLGDIKTSNNVFIVHGHDHGRMQAAARFLEKLGRNPIILHERPSTGDTVIEKLERYSNTSFAVVLLTPDDVGSTSNDRENLKLRARQNVILELGYFLAKLGRKRTVALVVDGVEIPSDFSGVLYIPFGKGNEWKLVLASEMKAIGMDIDMNEVIYTA